MEVRSPKVDRISTKTFRLKFSDEKIWFVSPVPGGFWVTQTQPERLSFFAEAKTIKSDRLEFLQTSHSDLSRNIRDGHLGDNLQRDTGQGLHPSAAGKVMSAVQGKVTAIHVKPGDEISHGQHLLTLESMKMEIHIHADHAGELIEILVQLGDVVKRKAHILTINKTGLGS